MLFFEMIDILSYDAFTNKTGKYSMKKPLDFKAVGARIKETRTSAGKSQKQLADMFECDQGYISQIEKGITKPSLAFLAAFSKFSGQSIDHLLFGKSDLPQNSKQKRQGDDAPSKRILEGMRFGVCLVQDGRIIYSNPAFAVMTERPLDSINQKDLMDDILLPVDRGTAKEGMKRVLSGELKSFSCQAECWRKVGDIAEIECTFTPMKHENRPALMGVFADITENKKLEKQKSYFLSTVTHDFETPVTTLMGYAELIALAEGMNEQAVDMANAIFRNGEKLRGMVQDFDFLFHAMLESRLLSPIFASVEANAILEELKKEFSAQILKKNLRLVLDNTESLPLLVVDKKLVERALNSLIQNAVNHTPSGGTITVRAGRRMEPEGTYAYFSVSNTGPGLPQELRYKIFDKFGNCPNVHRARGPGMGLTIVRLVAEAHGGKVEVESEDRKGSEFKIILPMTSQKAGHGGLSDKVWN